jgi:tetratricopeptide (TPR) repeat protein
MGVIENFEQMLAAGKDSALLRYGLGNEYLKAEQFEPAIDHLRVALELDPSYSAAWKLYGKALAGAARHADAVAAFEQGIETAEAKGDVQAAKEMRVFRKRAQQALLG